jgi:hypothetical protein
LSKRCIIFDIDGTLANCSHRVHHVNGKKKNWPAFMAEIPNDTPIPQTVALNKLISRLGGYYLGEPGHYAPIFLCSGRSENERKDTEEWLAKNRVEYEQMFMRKSGDYRQDAIVKKELLEEIRAKGFEPWIIFDDRQCVVDMWRKEGLFVLQCDPKQNHTDHVGYNFHESVTWPLTILVGPSGAGKSTWTFKKWGTEFSASAVISSDELRKELCGDFKDQTKNDAVFSAMFDIASTRLRSGLPVVLDATHLKNTDRLKAAKLVPERVPVRYVVIDRPLADKMKDAGWRASVTVKGRPLVQHHDQVFKSNLKDILAGDGLPNVTVQDERT